MPGGRLFRLIGIRSHLPENVKQIEIAKWQEIFHLLESDIAGIKKQTLTTDVINLLKPDENIAEIEKYVECLCQGAQLIKRYIKSEYADAYLVEDDKIYKLIYKQESASIGRCWQVGAGTIISAYAAFLGRPITFENLKDTLPLCPLGTGSGGPLPKHVISVPLLTEKKKCIAVFDFTKVKSLNNFTNADKQLCLCMVRWFGRSLSAEAKPFQERLRDYYKLIECFEEYASVHNNFNRYITDVFKILIAGMKIDRVNYYHIVKEEGEEETIIKYAQVGKDKWEILSNYKFKNECMAKEAIEKLETKNITAYDIKLLPEDIRAYFKNIDSYLCVPILLTETTSGALELINKNHSAAGFLDHDVIFANRCGIHCVGGRYYHDLYSKKKRTAAMCRHAKLTLLHQLSPFSIEVDHFRVKLLQAPQPESFYMLTYYPTQEELPNLPQYTWYIFREVFKLTDSDEGFTKIIKFIMMVQQGYRNIPYHNYEHAFNFCHCVFAITRMNTDIFTDLERKALIIAGLCHDIDHPGLTNRFILESEHELTKLYSESFLENHHSSLARAIVQYCEIFSDLSKKDYHEVMKLINLSILATDLSFYFMKRFQLMEVLSKDSFSLKEPEHKKLLMYMLVTAADLSGLGKTFKVAERLVRNLYKEFFAEANIATELGITPIYKNNQESKLQVPKFQVEFNTEVCLPCFCLLSIILQNTNEFHTRCCEICEKWSEIHKSGAKWDVTVEEYIYSG